MKTVPWLNLSTLRNDSAIEHGAINEDVCPEDGRCYIHGHGKPSPKNKEDFPSFFYMDVLVAKQNMTAEIIFPSIARKTAGKGPCHVDDQAKKVLFFLRSLVVLLL